MNGVPDTKYNTFRLQLSLYKRILELHYDIKVTNLYVVRFHPNAKSYQLVKVEYWPEYVEKLLVYCWQQIQAPPNLDETGLEQALESVAL